MAFAYNSLNIEEIKKSNQEKFGELFDFEKYKKQKEKLQILRKFVNDVNNNKLFIRMLMQMELEFIIYANDYLKNKQDLKDHVEEKINLYQNQIRIFDILIYSVKHFPKTQLKDKGKDLRINEYELKVLNFLKKRFLEFYNSLSCEEKKIPYYIEKSIDSMKIEEISPKKVKVSILPYFDHNNTDESIYPKLEVFLGQIYFLYNSINPDFIDEVIIDLVNLYLKSDVKDITDEELNHIKFKKIQLRYGETLEKLA